MKSAATTIRWAKAYLIAGRLELGRTASRKAETSGGEGPIGAVAAACYLPLMNLILLILVLLLLFGGGGFYVGGPAIGGGGVGLILLICLIIYFMGGFRSSKN